jgi:hypothetical protein
MKSLAWKTPLLACAFLLVVALGQGQNPPADRPAPPPPGAPQQAERMRLAFLVGAWEEEITYPGREAGADKGRGRWLARPDMGRYLMFRYEGSGPEGDYRAMGILTRDAATQKYRMWWFDDSGNAGEYTGDFVDENTLVLEYRGQADGRLFRERISYRRAGPGEVHTKIEQAYGDEEFRVYLEATAKRTEGPLRRGMGKNPGPAPQP